MTGATTSYNSRILSVFLVFWSSSITHLPMEHCFSNVGILSLLIYVEFMFNVIDIFLIIISLDPRTPLKSNIRGLYIGNSWDILSAWIPRFKFDLEFEENSSFILLKFCWIYILSLKTKNKRKFHFFAIVHAFVFFIGEWIESHAETEPRGGWWVRPPLLSFFFIFIN